MINLCFLGYDEPTTKPCWELLKLGFVFHDEQCARLTCFFLVLQWVVHLWVKVQFGNLVVTKIWKPKNHLFS
jgi:hypothetical protein